MSNNMQDNKTQDNFAFPKEWTVFGPVGKDDPEPDFAGMKDVPGELTIAGNRLARQKTAFADNHLDLAALLDSKKVGKTAYLLAVVEAAKAIEIELGAGADWWMKWWVNGAVVCDTLVTGNVSHPPSVLDHRFTARLKAGRNLLTVKVVSGNVSFVLAAGGPREMRAEVEIRKERDRLKAEESRRTGREIVERRQAAEERAQAELERRTRIEVSATGASASGAGARYQATVPDTLDLAERGAMALRALTQLADPESRYEVYLCAHMDQKPAFMSHGLSGVSHGQGGVCQPKAVEVLPLLRRMSGSTFNADVDRIMLESLLEDIEDDGLWWLKVSPTRKPSADDIVWTSTQPRAMLAVMRWYSDTGDPDLLKIAKRMVDGWIGKAVHYDSRAAYLACTYKRQGGFQKTGGEPDALAPYLFGPALQAYAEWHRMTGDRSGLDLGRQLVEFALKPAMWVKPDIGEWPTMSVPSEHAAWQGHFHTYTMGGMGLLDYAVAVNDAYLLEFAKNFYEYSRAYGIARLGHFPAVIGPLSMAKKWNEQHNTEAASGAMVSEGCCVADMIWMATRLSEAGVGDYWEDVDQYARNHLAELQLLDGDLLKQIYENSPAPTRALEPTTDTTQDVIDRSIGAFTSGGGPTVAFASYTICCVTNLSRALYQVWNAIVACRNDVAQINLLLNRASPWLDIDSHLPYEGRVVITNKTARKMHIRLPRWVDKKAVQCRLNDAPVPLAWLSNYLVVESVAPGDRVVLEFPVVQTTERWTELTYDITYAIELKANTVVDISPRADGPPWKHVRWDDGNLITVTGGLPLYRRGYYRQGQAPARKVWRHVAQPIFI